MSEPSTPQLGAARLMSSLQGLTATLVAIFQTRLELLATEVEEEKQRMLAVLGWGAVAVLMGTVACVFLAGFITVLLWDSHPLLALGGLTLAFALMCAGAWRRVNAIVHTPGGVLAASLAELQADHDALAAAAQRAGGGGAA
ncbi:MAG: phage holin family protein [Aquabacterium sp.]|nr:phage holin family protein [Aquabacterium sp.]